MKQGQSEITEEKARGFTSVFEQQAIVVSRFHQSKYVHIDLHAGSGFNEKVNVIGSPLLFTQVARKHRLDYLMFCVELDKNRAKTLGERLVNDARSFVTTGYNAELCDAVPDLLRVHGIEPQFAMGSVLLDPNGFAENDQIPWQALERLFHTCGRLDVLFNYPGTGYTRNRGHPLFVGIDDLPQKLSKKHWFVRQPLPVHKFTLCVGRNTDKLSIPAKMGLPFAQWESPEGERHRKKANMTMQEFDRLPCIGQQEFSFG